MVKKICDENDFAVRRNSSMSKKALLWPVMISVFLHLTVLAITGAIDLRSNISFEDVLSVTLQKAEPEKVPAGAGEIKKKKQKNPHQITTRQEKGLSSKEDEWREETVELGSTDVKYGAYLGKIKRKILQVWEYPQPAFERNEEGVVVVKMSIDADGHLSGVTLVTSSGSETLDKNALGVVQSAAPFDPLPQIYDLSRLNIIASFRYKITD